MRAEADEDAEPLPNPAQSSPLLARIFGANVAAAELRGGGPASLLYPIEATHTAGFAAKRLAEFAAGRLCARRALAELGITAAPIGVNSDRSPQWPASIVGSISHTSGYCCAVAARDDALASIGVDAEIVGRVTIELYTLIFTDEERTFLSALTAAERERASTVMFSAKEAFYKCQFGVTHQWLDFHDVSLRLMTADLHSGTFRADVRDRPGLERVKLPDIGEFAIEGSLAVTGITLRH